LVAFTDGISEATDPRDDEFGEERLIAAVEEARNLSPDALIAHIMAAADRFAGSAPQHDDMTLVVARCT
jgi:sigma-B regulation protein RsbU (phosphoserine phosphatase)